MDVFFFNKQNSKSLNQNSAIHNALISSYIAKDDLIVSVRLLFAHYTYTSWQIFSTNCHLNYYGRLSATLQIMRENYRYPLQLMLYSVIQLSKLEQRRVTELGQGSTRGHNDSNSVL